MSVATTTPLLTIPVNSTGNTVTGGGTSWGVGAWAEMIPVTPAAVQIVGVEMGTFSSGSASGVFWGLGLAIGASGSEVALGEYTFYYGNSGVDDDRGIRFPCPISVPAGVRVSIRLRNTAAVVLAVLNYYVGLDSDHASAAEFGFLPATSGSIFTPVLTPSGSAFGNSAYIELTSGIANEISLISVALETTIAALEWELELATGGAGTEVPITLSRETSLLGAFGGPKALALPGLYPIAANTRIAARLRKTGTSTTTKSVAVNYFGKTTLGGIEDPTGGGDPGTGTDPAVGTSLCGITAPLILMGELELDATTARWSRVIQPLNYPTTYRGGPHEPRIISVSPIARSLSDWTGHVVTGGTDIVLEDTDGVVRAAIAANTLLNKNFALWMTDDDSARAAATPYRVGNFLVKNWKLLGDMTVRLILADRVGAYTSTFNLTKQLPSFLLDTTTFTDLPIELVGRAAPIPYGILSDESASLSSGTVGVVPIWYVGTYTMSDGNPWYMGLVAGCATGGPISVFASTGAVDPVRAKMDVSLYDTDIAFPLEGQWTTVTGVSTNYIVKNGHRLTVILFKPGSASGEAMKDGTVPAVCNLGGIEDVGDGTGDIITSLPRQCVHLLNNFILQEPPGDADWHTIPQIGSPAYSIISTSTFETVKTTSETRLPTDGYLGAFLIGWDLHQLATADWLSRICLGGDFDLYVNRHGQICASMEDDSVAVVKSFVEITDIREGSYSTDKDMSKWANYILWDHMKRYPPSANISFLYDTTDWLFAKDVQNDGALETSQRDRQIFQYEDWVTRDFTLAIPGDVGLHKLVRMKRGPDFTTCDVDLCGTDLKPGDNYNVTHFAGAVATVRKCRLFTQVLDVMAGTVTLIGHDLVDV